MAKNISKVYLLDVPMEDDLKNTIYFASASAQQTYFQGAIGKTYTNVSYQSDTRTFRCPDQIDTVRQYNYIMFQNTAYSNKWFYGFIKSMTYVSDGYTDVIFEIDPLQTFMFDITVKASFVEREHVNDDTLGKHTVPEGLETGEYVNAGAITEILGTTVYDVYGVIGVTTVNKTTAEGSSVTISTTPSTTLNGMPNGLVYLLVDIWDAYSGLATNNINQVIKVYDNAGMADAIQCIFVLPKSCFGTGGTTDSVTLTGTNSVNYSVTATVSIPNGSNTALKISETTFTMNQSPWGSGFVKNNKMLTYPFNCLVATNNAGADTVYKFEDFTTPTSIKFNTYSAITPGGSVKLVPQEYKNTNGTGLGVDLSYSLTGGKYPMCSWVNDYYTNWLTQNAVNMEVKWTGAMVHGVAGTLSGALAGPVGMLMGATSGITNIYDTLQSMRVENYQAQLTPDQAKGNLNSGDVNWSLNKTCFTLVQRMIKPEYAKIIDNYFSMFGYKINEVKVPNVAHRQNWWYTKTVGANIVGNVPNEQMTKIKEAYDNGITFWSNPANFLDYSVSNGIVI